MIEKKLLVVAMVLASAWGVALAADDQARQTISINTPNPKVEDVENALFPKEVVALKDECAQMEKIGLRCQSVIPKSSLDTIQVTFARGSAVLTDEGKGFLRSVGAALQRKAGVWKSLIIEGHTDATGSDGANRRLSQQRGRFGQKFPASRIWLEQYRNNRTVQRQIARHRQSLKRP